ncbi:MAG: DUF448 domain-containing protein [Denitrovibrio sp.]|nr:MAG: DUF448 domain-containing protein [Denitrovibrio sp.]
MKGDNPPIRTCVVCGIKEPKSEMIRFVLENGVCIDENHTKHGRGAYVCKSVKCRETRINYKRLERSLLKFAKGRNRKTG